MKVNDNGVLREMTEQEIAEYEAMQVIPSYKDRVVSRIRERYSIDDEIAILRQRDTKPNEYEEYNSFVEEIKAQERW